MIFLTPKKSQYFALNGEKFGDRKLEAGGEVFPAPRSCFGRGGSPLPKFSYKPAPTTRPSCWSTPRQGVQGSLSQKEITIGWKFIPWFKELEKGPDLGDSFVVRPRLLLAPQIDLKIDFSAQVLTTGFWPAFKIDTLNPPEILSTNMDLFKQFYDHKTQSRSYAFPIIYSFWRCSHLGNCASGEKIW